MLSRKPALEIFLAVCILVIAGFFRIAYPQLAEFKGDECKVSMDVLGVVKGENFPCTGLISSKGISMPPFFTYLIAIPFLFFNDPAIASAFVGLLNTLAVLGCYLLCRKFFNKWIAIISALLFTFSPWAVLFSRKLWPQDVLPLFNIIFIYCLYLVLKESRSKAILPLVLILSLLPGFHLTAVALFAVFFVAIIFILPKINLKYFILGIVLAVIIYFPYLRHEFLYGRLSWINQFGKSNIINFSVFQGSLKIIAYENIKGHIGLPLSPSLAGELILTVLRFLFFIGFISSCVFTLKEYGRKTTFPYFYMHFNAEYLLITLWYSIPVLLFCARGVENHPHYFLILCPVQFIMIALGFGELWKIFCLKENNRALIFILIFIASFVKYPFLTIIFIISFITINSFHFFKRLKRLYISPHQFSGLYHLLKHYKMPFKNWCGDIILPCLMILALLSIITYEGVFIFNIFRQINLYGGANGDYGVVLKHQRDAAEYIINDAKDKYDKYGGIVYCENNLPFISLLYAEKKYPFMELTAFKDDESKSFGSGFRYNVDIDFDRSINFKKPLGYISYKYFGPVRVVISRNE